MFKEINVRELDRSPIQMISDDWALLTAGKEGDWNTMTVSWGGVGELLGQGCSVCFCPSSEIYPRIYGKIR